MMLGVAAIVVFTVASVATRPSNQPSVESRLNNFLNIPATEEVATTDSPEGVKPEENTTPAPTDAGESSEPTPPMDSEATEEPSPTEQPTPEATPTPESTPTPEATSTPEATPTPTPEPTPTLEATPTPTPDQNQPQPTQPSQPQNAAKPASTYVVKEGDTYGCIAEKYYGSYEYWPELVALNQGFGFEERRLFVGANIQLPAITVTKPVTSLCS